MWLFYPDQRHLSNYALQEAPKAVIIIGDTFYGDLDQVMAIAKQLRAAGTRLFLIQQGRNGAKPRAHTGRSLRMTGGAYVQFNPQAEHIEERLPEMFAAITSYVIDGLSTPALEQMTATPFVMDPIQQNNVERDEN